MTRGLRGATTVEKNDKEEILMTTKRLLEEMVSENNVVPEKVSHVFISATKDLDAIFPAQALRLLEGWTYVPVMCMRELDVVNSLEKCIRVMMVVHTEQDQKDIKHIFHNEAVKLRPDLIDK